MNDEPPLPPPPVRWWSQLVDPLCSPDSRWSSSPSGHTRLPDIGDFLVSKLQESAWKMENDKPIAGWSKKLLQRLGDYKSESRLLVKLEDTGHVIQLLQHGIETTLHILHINNSETKREWSERLQEERNRRVAMYVDLLTRHEEQKDEDLVKEMGGDEQQLQVLTLMKHGLNRFHSVLIPSELDIISRIFDALVLHANTVIDMLPNWFATTSPDNSQKTYVDRKREETCLRQATVLASLSHPNVRTFYGACHVGKAFILHEIDRHALQTWSFFLDCALGLDADGKRGVLSGLCLERIQRKCEKQRDYVHDFYSKRILADVIALGHTIFKIMAQASGISDFDSVREIPIVKPDFLDNNEWNLLQVMWNADSINKTSLSDVVKKMKAYVRKVKEREEMHPRE